jgi:HEAT repeat protein
MYRPEPGVALPGVMVSKPGDIVPSSRSLRQRMREVTDDLKKLTENSDPQVRAAGIHALSDLENDPGMLAGVLKPLLTSARNDASTRRAAAEALSHALEVSAVQMDKSRPLPYLRSLRLILPVAALGLDDEDTGVRRASLEACARAALMFDELAGDPLSAVERRAVFRPALTVMEEILPKLNAAARDSVPELRVAACHVLEALVLGMQRLQRYKGEPLPVPAPDKSKPTTPPGTPSDAIKKKASLPTHRSGRGKAPTGPSQWAMDRSHSRISLPVPPVPLPDESDAPDVVLDRPTKLPGASAPRLHTVALRARQLDELPPPTLADPSMRNTVQILIANLKDADYRVRLASVDALETLGERAAPAIPTLVAALSDTNKFVRWSAARTLGSLNPRQADEVVPGLTRLLSDREDRSVRLAAAKALELYGEHAKEAVPLLARVINRGDKEYIIAILRAIQGIGTDAAKALPNVAWILSDRTQPPSVRIEAAQTLGRFGPLAKGQLPVLLDIMNKETDEDVRNAASTAVLAVDRPEKE